MRPLFILFLLITLATLTVSGSCLAQNPNYDVTILADGKPLELTQGIPVGTKAIHLIGQLTPKSQQEYPQLKHEVLIHKATLNLVRDIRRVGFITWPSDGGIATLFKEAKVGDRFLVQFDDVELQTKQGQTQKLDNSKLVQIMVRE
ncbi:hypothetical protein [Spirosoma litoris]